MIIPWILASSYSVLASDDFSHVFGVGVFHSNFIDYFIASIKYSATMYMGWQGTYFSMFLQALLSPLNNFGFPQLRCVMVTNSTLFFLALIFFLFTILKKIKCEYSGLGVHAVR